MRTNRIEGTGILSANSTPEGAMVYIDNKPYSATNTSIGSLKPGEYTVKIQKQGYSSWQKEISIKKELITEVEALLTRIYPELKPLTFTGAQKPLLSPDKQKIVFSASINGDTSLWLLEIVERPFNIASNARQILTNTEDTMYTEATLTWSPDSKELLLTLDQISLLLNTITKSTQEVENPQETKQKWQKEIDIEENKLLQNLSSDLVKKINGLEHKEWSPDRNFILYQETNEQQTIFKIINFSPDKLVSPTQKSPSPAPEYTEKTIYSTPQTTLTKLVWYPDSKHLIVLEKDNPEATRGKLSLIEADGENKCEFFSGIIKDNHIFPFSSGTKAAILTTFNPESEEYNLYSVSLR